MKPYTKLGGRTLGSLAFIATVFAAHAQTPPPPKQAASAAAQADDDDVIKLDKFEVTSESVHGYVASESNTGTRMKVKIADSPFNVQVVTSDFINDFAAYDLNDQMAFTSSYSASEIEGQYQLRGFTAPTYLVDGYRRVGLNNSVDVERIETIKGPAAGIYGPIQPGGVINVLTKLPLSHPEDGLELAIGSEQLFRISAYSTGPAGTSGKLTYRVFAGYSTQDYGQEFTSKRVTNESATLQYKVSDTTALKLRVEHAEEYEHPQNTLPDANYYQPNTYYSGTASPGSTNNPYTQYFGVMTSLRYFNPQGPEAFKHIRMDSATFTAEHTFNDWWNLRVSANTSKNPQNSQINSASNYYPYGYEAGPNYYKAGTPNEEKMTPEYKYGDGSTPQQSVGTQIDNLFTFNTGPIKHNLLVTMDYNHASETYVLFEAPTGYYLLSNPNGPATTTDGGYPYASAWNYPLYAGHPSIYGVNTSANGSKDVDWWDAYSDYGFFASDQMKMFNDKLILIGGGRYDDVRNWFNDYYGANAQLPKPTNIAYTTTSWTHEVGLVYKLTKNISLFTNQSAAFNPQPNVGRVELNPDQALVTSGTAPTPEPNQYSTGADFGVKMSFFKNRLNMTLDRFEIIERNQYTNVTDEGGNSVAIPTGKQQAKGYEFDGNWQVTNDLTLVGQYGYVKTKILDSEFLTFLDGTSTQRVPRYTTSLAAKYTVPHGKFKRLFFIAKVNYYAKSIISLGSGKAVLAAQSKPIYNVVMPNGQLVDPNQPEGTEMQGTGAPGTPGADKYFYLPDGRDNIYNAPYASLGLGMGYTFDYRLGRGGKVKQKVQVNVNNVMNRFYLYGAGVPGTGRAVIFTYTVTY